MKCNHPRCKRDKKRVLVGTVLHGLFGEICPECAARCSEQNKEVKAKVAVAVRGKYGKPAKRVREVMR